MKYKVSMDKKGKVSVDKELGKSLTDAPMPRNLEIAEKCVSEGKSKLLTDVMEYLETRKVGMNVSEKRFVQEHQRLHAFGEALLINEQLLKTDKENEKKAKFFRRLNKVLDKKLVKPSIIIEYVNQYQRGDK
tara:strand:+ start:43 stop:438 length:396 start_codon:yes stop_codon:yes gene_type:complete